MKYTGMGPQPDDLYLPSGWVCTQWDGTILTFTRDDGRFELVATPSATTPQYADLGLLQCWEMTVHQRCEDFTSETLIGHVPTQQAAATGLRASMKAINRALQETEATEWLVLSPILAEIEVPSAMSLTAGTENTS